MSDFQKGDVVYPIKEVRIRNEGEDLVLVNVEDDDYENAIICTIGHPNTDYPKEYLLSFAEQLVKILNQIGR